MLVELREASVSIAGHRHPLLSSFQLCIINKRGEEKRREERREKREERRDRIKKEKGEKRRERKAEESSGQNLEPQSEDFTSFLVFKDKNGPRKGK